MSIDRLERIDKLKKILPIVEAHLGQIKNDNQTPTFKGKDCTVDCSGHKAGYNWAAKKGINNPDDCGGKSNSFIEGCKAYAEEQ